jgi:hypothetical protein
MAINTAFNAKRGSNLEVAPAVGSASSPIDQTNKSVRCVNWGAALCYVRIGTGPQTASSADTPIRAGSEVVLAKAEGEDTIAYLSATGTTLSIQTGEGGV